MLDYTDTNCIERELLLAKVSILGPEYVEDQYAGGPTHSPRRSPAAKLEAEAQLVQNVERGAHPEAEAHSPPPLTPSELLRMKSDHLQSISVLAEQFGARIGDVSEHSVIVEMSGKTSKVEAFLSLLKPFGLLESARTGMWRYVSVASLVVFIFRTGLMAMPRTPFKSAEEAEAAAEEGGTVDASLLPPG